MKHRTLLQGDVLEQFKQISDESIDVCITSPPYYNLRSYDQEGQIGLEKTIPEYMDRLMAVMVEIERVTKPTGTIWVNIGDTYAGSPSGWGDDSKYKRSRFRFEQSAVPEVLPKSLCMMPERFGVACVDAVRLRCRNKIPWLKNNTLPSPVKDRFTCKWEHVFFFSKSQKYYANLDNVRIPEVKGYAGHVKGELNDNNHFKFKTYPAHKTRKQSTLTKQNFTPDATGKPKSSTAGFNERWRASREGLTKKDYVQRPDDKPVQTGLSFSMRKAANRPGQRPHTCAARHTGNFDVLTGKCINDPKGKNPGDVFVINTTPLQTKCRNCSWKAADIREDPERGIRYCFTCKGTELLDHHAAFPVELPHYILRFAAPAGGMVLDPFMGSGSTAVAAEKLGLKWCGIELNPDSILYAQKRLEQYRNEPLLEIPHEAASN